MRDLFWLTDALMDRRRPFFPKSRGKPRVDDRRVPSGMIFVQRNGLRWRDGEGRARHRCKGRPERGLRPAEDALQPLETVEPDGRVRHDHDRTDR
jgi:transposase